MKLNAIIGLAAAAALGLAGAAMAEGPVAGEVAEGSLAGKTQTFVSYGGIYQDGQIKAYDCRPGSPAASCSAQFVLDLPARGETGADSGLGFYDWRAADPAAFRAFAARHVQKMLAQVAQVEAERPAVAPAPRRHP